MSSSEQAYARCMGHRARAEVFIVDEDRRGEPLYRYPLFAASLCVAYNLSAWSASLPTTRILGHSRLDDFPSNLLACTERPHVLRLSIFARESVASWKHSLPVAPLEHQRLLVGPDGLLVESSAIV